MDGGRSRRGRDGQGLRPGGQAGALAGLLREERGTIAVLVAAGVTCLMLASALAVDVGVLYAGRARLQAVADAAALAGAQALPRADQARALALEYAQRNGIPPEAVAVEVDPIRRTVRVTVEGRSAVALAAVAGFSSVRLGAESAAEQAPAGAVRGAQPLGVSLQDFSPGRLYRIKLGPCGSSRDQGCGGGTDQEGGERPARGNFHALALGGRGAAAYRDNLARGYPGWLYAGDEVETEPGNMAGPTEQGLRQRLEADPYSTWDRPRAGSPRVLLVPVVETFAGVRGRDRVRVVGFAAFFLESVSGGAVDGRFIRWAVTGRPGAAGQADYGAYVLRLIR